ncbi:cysteine proteinase inhibitor 1-like [Wolffia australiana]
MTTQLRSILLLALLSAVIVHSYATSNPPTPGWTRIKKVEDYHVQSMAEFAVAEHNKRTGENLEYIRIYRGYVDGQYYRLFIEATNHVKAQKYEGVVFEKLWDKIRELVYFKTSS